MQRLLLALATALLLSAPALRADDDFAPVSANTNQVEGLTLPADMKVPADAGLIKIKAKCDGPVRFTVLGSAPGVRAETAGHTVVISIPPAPGAAIVVYASTVLVKKGPDGKILSAEPSEIARTNILIDKPENPLPGPPTPEPKPQPKPQPKLAGKGYAVLIHDPQAATPEIGAVLNSAKLRALPSLAVRVVDIHDPFLKTKNLADKVGATPWLIVQNAQGQIVASQALPATEDALVSLISSLRGQ